MASAIKPRERDAILQSLRAGVVPRIGLRHIQVGRKDEVSAVIDDLNRIKNGSATIRFIIGKFGTGKSFFLNLSRMIALENKFVVVQGDISPSKRLHATGGQARALYSELMQNMAIRSKPNGGAIASVVEKWISDVDHQLRLDGGEDDDVKNEIHKQLKSLQDYVSGYDFANVIIKYLEGYQTHNEELMSSALRWLRGEFTTKTDAKNELEVRSYIDDRSIYDYLKLMAHFVKLAGYAGLLVNIDEMGVLSHRLNHAQARNANYEVILRTVNDCLQGDVSGIGFIFAGTDSFFDDKRRGLNSYEALSTRLSENQFAGNGLKDFSGPVIRLKNLSPEDLYVLLHNIRNVHASGDPENHLIPDEGIKAFMQHCSKTLGAEYFKTPRDTVKSFTGLLAVLEQNPSADWRKLLPDTLIEKTTDPEEETNPDDSSKDDDLPSFKL